MKKILIIMTIFFSFASMAQDRVGNGANILNEYAACDSDELSLRIRGVKDDIFYVGELTGSISAKFRCEVRADLTAKIPWKNSSLYYCSEKTKLAEKLVIRIEMNSSDNTVTAFLKRIQTKGRRALELATMDCINY